MLGNMFEELMGDEMPDQLVGGTSQTAQTLSLVETTRLHRLHMAEHGYPQPGRWASMMYAFEELAEFIDAHVTRNLAGQKRNNEKTLDAKMELGDALAMLCTALLSQDDFDTLQEDVSDEREIIGQALYAMGVACLSYNENAIHEAIARVAKLGTLIGTEPRDALKLSNEKIRAKHAKPENRVTPSDEEVRKE